MQESAIRSRLARRLPLGTVYISNHAAMTAIGRLDPDGELFRMWPPRPVHPLDPETAWTPRG